MITSKVLALWLLLICPMALARVKLDVTMEIISTLDSKRNITQELKIDINETATIYNTDGMRVDIQLLEETENGLQVRYTVYDATKVETVSSPAVYASYNQTESFVIGRTTNQGTTFKPSLNMKITAHKE